MKVYGSDFFWNIKSLNPYRNLIPEDLDLVVVHNPPKGFNDGGGSGFGGSGGFGCPETRRKVESVRPRLCVSGHIHAAGGGRCRSEETGTVYVNAAVVRGDHRAKKVAKGEKQPFWVMTPDGHDSAAVVVEI